MPRRKIKNAKGLGEWLIRYWLAEKRWEEQNRGKNPRKHGGPLPDISAINPHDVDLDRNDELLPILDRENVLHVVIPVCPREWTRGDLEEILADDNKEIDYDDSALADPDEDEDLAAAAPKGAKGSEAKGGRGGRRKTAKKYKKQLGFVVMGGCR